MKNQLINNINHQIEILTAYRDGKVIEYRMKHGTDWLGEANIAENLNENACFNFEFMEYRIKPKKI